MLQISRQELRRTTNGRREGREAPTQSISCCLDEESRLIARCLNNDDQAWRTLISRYEKCVYRFAYTLCRNRDDASDIASLVFVRVYQNLHTFRHEACFSSWLFRIVRNTHLDLCVRPAWRNTISLDAGNVDGTSPSNPILSELAVSDPTPEAQSIRNEVARLL